MTQGSRFDTDVGRPAKALGRLDTLDGAPPGRRSLVEAGYPAHMRLMRGAVAVGIASKIYTEVRKPENQRRIKQAVEQIRAKRAASGSSPGRRVKTR